MAGKNNFYPYGESSTNILNNSEYQTDQERTAGAARGAIARSKIYNKALRQGAAGAYAVADLVAAAGKDADDASAATLAENFRAAVSYQARSFVAQSVSISGTTAVATVPELASTAQADLPALFTLALSLDQALPAGSSVQIASSLPSTTLVYPIYSGGEPLEDDVITAGAVSLLIDTVGGKAFFKAGGGKIPADLPPLLPNFTVERSEDGTKIIAKADKLLASRETAMLAGGTWVLKDSAPTSPKDGTVKEWSRAELITTAKPYDGLYLGDVTPSDAVTETIIWIPENQDGKVVLVPFLVLSVDYLGGVYVTRLYTESEWLGAFGSNSTYAGSTADNWFEKTYLGSVLHESVASQVLTCDVPVMNQGTVSRRCWPLSSRELDSASSEVGGEFMPYFSTAQRRIAYLDGGTVGGVYWMRTMSSTTLVFTVTAQGSFETQTVTNGAVAYRPCFVLPKDFKIQQRPDGSYTVWNEMGLMTLADIEESTDTTEVLVNAAEDVKAGGSDIAPFIFAQNGYNENSGALLVRKYGFWANAIGANYQSSDASTKAISYVSDEAVNSALTKTLKSSIRALVQNTTFKWRYNDGSQYEMTAKGFLLSAADLSDSYSNWNMGKLIPCFSTKASRVLLNESTKTATEWWLRDNSAANQNFIVSTAGDVVTALFGSANLRFSFMLPLDTPIRALADGSYDLVPEDPALSAQAVSTLAEGDEESTFVQWEVDWPADTPAYVRQYTYNQKGQYQTMVQGGIASTEDAPAFELPVFTGNHAIFGDEVEGRIELYESGDLTLYPGTYDLFLIGGGGSGIFGGYDSSEQTAWHTGLGGGGSGYTETFIGEKVDRVINVECVVGAGGAVNTTANNQANLGSSTYLKFSTGSMKEAKGGGNYNSSPYVQSENGQNGGSGGGAGQGDGPTGGVGGSDGSNGGNSPYGPTGGIGQGTTTKAFGEDSQTLYAGGGGGPGLQGGSGGGGRGAKGSQSGNTSATSGTPNTGSGGGCGYKNARYNLSAGAGGSGLIIIRWSNV